MIERVAVFSMAEIVDVEPVQNIVVTWFST
jgi:hypothetical protein